MEIPARERVVMVNRVFTSGVFVLVCTSAFAGPTCLNLMPIADYLGHKECLSQVYSTGNERNVDKGRTWGHAYQFGFYGIGEFGIDNDTLGNSVLNAKLHLWQSEGAGKYSVSAGLQNVGVVGTSIDRYVVGRADFKSFRLHAGALWNDCGHGMFGIDGPLPLGMSYMLDTITGDHAATWVGVNIPAPIKGLLVTVAGGFPAEKSEGIKNTITLAYGFKF